MLRLRDWEEFGALEELKAVRIVKEQGVRQRAREVGGGWTAQGFMGLVKGLGLHPVIKVFVLYYKFLIYNI